MPDKLERKQSGWVIDRYALYGVIASGGMARVHFGRLRGPVGFARTVAIKRLHSQYASDPEFVAMFLDEARLAARIRHPNVVPVLDVIATEDELLLVMEYVLGESLGRLMRAAVARGARVPAGVVVAIVSDLLAGLHAAHEANDEQGSPLSIVHRDVSPDNVLVGADGHTRVLDFGVAKAAGRSRTTQDGQLKGKLAYMAPEQLRGLPVDRRTDVYAAGVVLWEMMTGERLFKGENEGAVVALVLEGDISTPTDRLAKRRIPLDEDAAAPLRRMDAVTRRALARSPNDRFSTAHEMALALEQCAPRATPNEAAVWVEENAGDALAARMRQVVSIESGNEDGPEGPRTGSLPPATESEPHEEGVPTLQGTSRGVSPRAWRTGVFPAALILTVAGVLLVFWSRTHGEVAPQTSSAAHVSATATAPEVPTPTSSPIVATPFASAKPTPQPPVAANSSPSGQGPSSPGNDPRPPQGTAPSSAKEHPRPPRPAAPAPRVQCDPPFSYDEQGAKHFKPECL